MITKGINIHTGSAMPLNQANVDTDQIIPKQFLTSVSRSGYGKHLFHDWRYLDQLNAAKLQQIDRQWLSVLS